MIENVPFRKDAIKDRIDDMAVDVEDRTQQELKDSMHPSSLQLDESTDEASCSQLLVFVRYVSGLEVKEEFLFCSPLKTTSRAEGIFAVVNDYFHRNDHHWSQAWSVCTDGAPAMVGGGGIQGLSHLYGKRSLNLFYALRAPSTRSGSYNALRERQKRDGCRNYSG